jgi:hypothetical protein
MPVRCASADVLLRQESGRGARCSFYEYPLQRKGLYDIQFLFKYSGQSFYPKVLDEICVQEFWKKSYLRIWENTMYQLYTYEYTFPWI